MSDPQAVYYTLSASLMQGIILRLNCTLTYLLYELEKAIVFSFVDGPRQTKLEAEQKQCQAVETQPLL